MTMYLYGDELVKICKFLLGEIKYEDRKEGFKIGDIKIYEYTSPRSYDFDSCPSEIRFEDSKGNKFSRKDISENLKFMLRIRNRQQEVIALKELNYGKIELEIYENSLDEHVKINEALDIT